MIAPGATLRTLLADPGVLVVVECYSVLTARMVEKAGFTATYIGGSAMGSTHAAVPDHGLVSVHEMVEHAWRIASSISIPLIVDADQGGETSLNVRRTVRDFEHAGVAAIHIEDTVNPKHLFDGDRLVPIAEMCARIAAATDARRSDEFVIIARTDELINRGTVDEVINRGIAYAAEGADVYMVVNIRRESDMQAITSAVPIPVLDVNHPIAVAVAGGLKVDLFADIAATVAARAHLALLDEIKETGQVDRKRHRLDRDYFAELIDDPAYRALAKSWAVATSSSDGPTEGDR